MSTPECVTASYRIGMGNPAVQRIFDYAVSCQKPDWKFRSIGIGGTFTAMAELAQRVVTNNQALSKVYTQNQKEMRQSAAAAGLSEEGIRTLESQIPTLCKGQKRVLVTTSEILFLDPEQDIKRLSKRFSHFVFLPGDATPKPTAVEMLKQANGHVMALAWSTKTAQELGKQDIPVKLVASPFAPLKMMRNSERPTRSILKTAGAGMSSEMFTESLKFLEQFSLFCEIIKPDRSIETRIGPMRKRDNFQDLFALYSHFFCTSISALATYPSEMTAVIAEKQVPNLLIAAPRGLQEVGNLNHLREWYSPVDISPEVASLGMIGLQRNRNTAEKIHDSIGHKPVARAVCEYVTS